MIPEHLCYSVHNLLETYDSIAVIEEEEPKVVIACGSEAAKCLDADGFYDYVEGPDITSISWSPKQCARAREKVIRIMEENDG